MGDTEGSESIALTILEAPCCPGGGASINGTVCEPELSPPEHCGHPRAKLSLVQDWKSEQQDDNPCLPAQTWAPCAHGCVCDGSLGWEKELQKLIK